MTFVLPNRPSSRRRAATILVYSCDFVAGRGLPLDTLRSLLPPSATLLRPGCQSAGALDRSRSRRSCTFRRRCRLAVARAGHDLSGIRRWAAAPLVAAPTPVDANGTKQTRTYPLGPRADPRSAAAVPGFTPFAAGSTGSSFRAGSGRPAGARFARAAATDRLANSHCHWRPAPKSPPTTDRLSAITTTALTGSRAHPADYWLAYNHRHR